MTRNRLSFLLVAGFLEELLEVLDIWGTCFSLSARFGDTLNKTRADTSNVVAQSYDQDKLGIFLKQKTIKTTKAFRCTFVYGIYDLLSLQRV